MRELSSVADMQVFAQVAATGSMSSAARALGISPGAVSKIIGRLEDRLGLRLFHRTTRQLVLSDAGNGLHERVEAILAAVDEAEDYVAGGVGRARGVLRVTAPTSFGRMHVAPHLGQFFEQHPDLSIDLQLSDAFVDIVQNGFDLAIRIAELGDSTLVARRLAPNHRLLVATPGYLAQAGTPRSPQDLADHALLNHTGEPWRLEGPGGSVQVPTEARLRTNSSEVVREAVLAGLGIALRSTWDVGGDITSGRLTVIMPEWRTSRRIAVYAVYPSRRHLPPKVRLFIDHFAAVYGPTPYWNTGLALTEGE